MSSIQTSVTWQDYFSQNKKPYVDSDVINGTFSKQPRQVCLIAIRPESADTFLIVSINPANKAFPATVYWQPKDSESTVLAPIPARELDATWVFNNLSIELPVITPNDDGAYVYDKDTISLAQEIMCEKSPIGIGLIFDQYVKQRCEICESFEIRANALSRWNCITEEWEHDDVTGGFDCLSCGATGRKNTEETTVYLWKPISELMIMVSPFCGEFQVAIA